MPTRNLRDGTLVIRDGAGTPNSTTVPLHDEALTWIEASPVVNVLDRGTLSHMRPGPESPVTGEFTAKFKRFETAAGDPSPYEAITRTGAAAAWTSTNDDGGDVYTVELVFTIADPDGGSDEVVTFAKVCPLRITFQQGDQYDTLTVVLQDFETAPDVS